MYGHPRAIKQHRKAMQPVRIAPLRSTRRWPALAVQGMGWFTALVILMLIVIGLVWIVSESGVFP